MIRFSSLAFLAGCLQLLSCTSSAPVVHYHPIGSNVFTEDGKKFLEKTSRDSVYVSCTFISGTNSQSIFYVKFKNQSRRTVTIDPPTFYLVNSENTFNTQYDHSIDPTLKLPLIDDEIAYYEGRQKDASTLAGSKNQSTKPRADAAFQLKFLRAQRDYWQTHVLKKTILAPNETLTGDVVFTWTPKNKQAYLHIPTRKDDIVFPFAQSVTK